MKWMSWRYFLTIGFLITVLTVSGVERVKAQLGTGQCGTCPPGSTCQEVGPAIWMCEAGEAGPGNPAPPPNDEACGDSAAPSCGGWCDNGASCLTTSDNPDCHCKANANGAPQCTGAKVVKSYAPIGSLNNNGCHFPGDCWSFFPSVHNMTGCSGQDVKGVCKVSYLCCNSNQVISCTTGAGDTHEIESAACPAGEMKVSARTSFYFNTDGDRITQRFVTCRRNCGCVVPCTAASPSAVSLISPGNGTSVSGTSASLSWSPVTSWGTKCPAPNSNQYKLYIGLTNPPALYSTLGSTTTAAAYPVTSGKTYHWYVQATNGQEKFPIIYSI